MIYSGVLLILIAKISHCTLAGHLHTMFEFEEPYRNNNKQLKLFNEDKTALLNDKPVGLHRTVLDLEFPERVGTSNTDRLYRIVQCLATGNVEYLQKKIYKSLKVKLTSRESFSDSAASCTNEVVLTLSPPGTISTDFHLTDHYKLHEKRVTLAKTQEKTVDFQDVLNDGLLDMELFWLNFEITGKCSKYLVVELLKPNNIDPLGNDCDPTSILVP